MSPLDPVWDELGKIDYLLDQLARNVERGDVGRDVYERLSPRYLERRAELAAILANRAVRYGAAPLADIGIPPADEPPLAYGPPAAVAARPAPHGRETPPAPSAGARMEPRVAKPPRPAVSAGAWMTYAGAFLVVVAVAIFTIYAWGAMPAAAKLAVLALVTAAFYAGGDMVRTKLDLPAVGVALVGVGSAMLLFDGWAVINAFGLSGPWPWAVLLLVCSAAYWRTELRIAGGWFGAVGAAAQVGWWWMLGQALHLPSEWQIAGIALVGLAWALAGERVGVDGPLAALGSVLRAGSLVLVLVTTVGMLMQPVVGDSPGTLAMVVAALVTAVAATVVAGLRVPALRRFGAALHIPVLFAVLTYDGPSGSAALLCIVLAFAYGAYAVALGGGGFAAVALLLAAAGAGAVSRFFSWEPALTLAVTGTLFAAFSGGGFRLRRAHSSSDVARAGSPSSAAGRVWYGLGFALLALTTFVATPVAADGVPLLAVHVTDAHAIVALWELGLWALLVALTRRQEAGWAAAAWSFYALAAGAAWALPGLHSAWYATALLLLAVAWRQSEPASGRMLAVDHAWLVGASRVLVLSLAVGGLAASVYFFSARAYPVAVLFAVAALAWAADGVRAKAWWALVPAAAFGVSAAFVAVWQASGPAFAGVAGAAAGAALALAGAFGPRRPDGWGAFLATGGALAGTVAAAAAIAQLGDLSAALIFVAGAWALSAVASGLPYLFGVAGLFVSFALRAALDWRDPSPVVTIVSFSALAAALFAPQGLALGMPGSALRRASRGLGLAGLATAAQLAVLGLLQAGSAAGLGTHAFQVGEIGLGAGLLLTGAITVMWSAVERFEPGGYVGYGIGLLGVFAFMDLGGVTRAEFYLLAIAAYAIAMGVLYTRRGEGRRMPKAADGVAFASAVVAPFLLSLNAFDVVTALQHGLWTLGLAVIAIVAGLMTRTRIHFLGGIAIAVLEALWLSRSVLFALPTWVWIGLAGLALIGGGVTFARRELLGAASRRVSEGMTGWR